MTLPPLIALSGKLKSGKSTLARALSEELGIPIYPLAEPIKEAATALGDRDAWGPTKARWMQQGIGKLCTDRDTNYFVNLWFEQHSTFRSTGAIVDDVRRDPELEAFIEAGFTMVRLHVPTEVQIERGAPDDETLLHPTETMLDHHDWDTHIWDMCFAHTIGVPAKLAHIRMHLDEGDPNSTLPGWDSYRRHYEGIFDASGNRVEALFP